MKKTDLIDVIKENVGILLPFCPMYARNIYRIKLGFLS